MISFNKKGDFSKTMKFLSSAKNNKILNVLNKFGDEGVRALSKNTPVDTGLTSNSWYYKTTNSNGKASISWYNSNVIKGVPIAILLQYGHGTRNGGWVEGLDYINPAMKPIFDNMSNKVWKEVNRL